MLDPLVLTSLPDSCPLLRDNPGQTWYFPPPRAASDLAWPYPVTETPGALRKPNLIHSVRTEGQ